MGTDFQGRKKSARQKMIATKNFVFMNVTDEQVAHRRIFTKALKAYGPGVAHLESVMQETILDIIDTLDQKNGQPVSCKDLTSGLACCVIASLMFGEKYSFDDQICKDLKNMSTLILDAIDPLSKGAVLDVLPFLLKFQFVLPDNQKMLRRARKIADKFVWSRIAHAKKTFDPSDKRGCLDYFIEAQQQDFDKDGKPVLDDEGMKGLLLSFVNAGIETSSRSLTQIFLDILSIPGLQKDLQEEIDKQFEPTQVITLKDKDKLPQLESYMMEHFRYLSLLPFLFPHMTVRDTEVAGFKIPADTMVLMNSYYLAHNPDVYDDPFTVQPKRFLDKNGQVVDRDHPLRQNFFAFGMGRRSCTGELLAKSRIFLFVANLLQKYNLEVFGELPDSDIRKYKMATVFLPPNYHMRLLRRQ
ncbi:cytochrome P450 2C23-like [Watersipora subatra]|uniref:cytochrome P450 2C23-like n=1 Tax=Watersipora subatra TaxID=2589382 RepID=UPI00355BCA03